MWEQLETFQKAITCPRLSEAWRIMLMTRRPEDCQTAVHWAEYGTQAGITHFRLACRAADLAAAETALRDTLARAQEVTP